MTTHSDCCFQPTQISHARSPHTLEIASISHQRVVKPQGYDLLEMCSSSKVNLLTSGSRSQTVKLFTPESPGWQRLHGTFVPFNRVCCAWAVPTQRLPNLALTNLTQEIPQLPQTTYSSMSLQLRLKIFFRVFENQIFPRLLQEHLLPYPP